MEKIDRMLMQRNLVYKGKVILKYRIEYPQIKQKNDFNTYNYEKASNLKRLAEGELFEEAKKQFDYAESQGYPFNQYEVVSQFNVTYNYQNYVSLYIDEYIYQGGAHGNTLRTSQTWNLENDKMIKLSQWFKDPNYVSELIDNINEQIKENIKNNTNSNNIKKNNMTTDSIKFNKTSAKIQKVLNTVQNQNKIHETYFKIIDDNDKNNQINTSNNNRFINNIR